MGRIKKYGKFYSHHVSIYRTAKHAVPVFNNRKTEKHQEKNNTSFAITCKQKTTCLYQIYPLQSNQNDIIVRSHLMQQISYSVTLVYK